MLMAGGWAADPEPMPTPGFGLFARLYLADRTAAVGLSPYSLTTYRGNLGVVGRWLVAHRRGRDQDDHSLSEPNGYLVHRRELGDQPATLALKPRF